MNTKAAELTLEEKVVWRVVGNRDDTEGRGPTYTKAFCEIQATAIRLAKGGYVQGSDCPVEEITLYRRKLHGILGPWLGPVSIQDPTNADLKVQERLDELAEKRRAKEAAIAKAQDLGLSDEELEALRS